MYNNIVNRYPRISVLKNITDKGFFLFLSIYAKYHFKLIPQGKHCFLPVGNQIFEILISQLLPCTTLSCTLSTSFKLRPYIHLWTSSTWSTSSTFLRSVPWHTTCTRLFFLKYFIYHFMINTVSTHIIHRWCTETDLTHILQCNWIGLTYILHCVRNLFDTYSTQCVGMKTHLHSVLVGKFYKMCEDWFDSHSLYTLHGDFVDTNSTQCIAYDRDC